MYKYAINSRDFAIVYSVYHSQWRWSTYHCDYNKRQGSELHMVKKEEGKEKEQLTGPEPATSKSIANPLAVEPWPLPATIN